MRHLCAAAVVVVLVLGVLSLPRPRGEPFAGEVRWLLGPRERDQEIAVTLGNQAAYRAPLPIIAQLAPITPAPTATAMPPRPPRRPERYGPIEPGATLYSIAKALQVPHDQIWQAVVALWRANKGQFAAGNLHGLQVGTFLEVPSDLAERMAAMRTSEAQAIVANQQEEWYTLQRRERGKQPTVVAHDTEARAPTGVGQTPDSGAKAASFAIGDGQRFFYMGAGSCAASACHGSVTPRQAAKTGIRRNEHTHWLTKDQHARAYEVLLKPRSIRIAHHLNLAEPPSKSEKCLVCHTLYIPKALRGPSYQVEDGVSCEACHGPSEGWLGLHIGRGYETALQVGMSDTRNLVKRAEQCVSCHVGDDVRSVDHELIAAGHPDLVFDLETYTAMLPPHWRPTPSAGVGGRAWAVGQAVALREGLKRLARRTQQRAAPAWPEFAEFDCFACHHDVKNIESTYYFRDGEKRLQESQVRWQASWRQQHGYTGVAGMPPWNPARYFIFRQLLQAVAPESRVTLDQELNRVNALMAKVGATDPVQLAAAASRAAQVVDSLLPKVASLEMHQELVSTIVRNITGDSDAIADAGMRVAEQAAMAMETFVTSARKQGKPLTQEPAVTQALQQLFQSLEKPEEFNREPSDRETSTPEPSARQQFITQMRAIHSFLTQP